MAWVQRNGEKKHTLRSLIIGKNVMYWKNFKQKINKILQKIGAGGERVVCETAETTLFSFHCISSCVFFFQLRIFSIITAVLSYDLY